MRRCESASSEFDFKRAAQYGFAMKDASTGKRAATPADIVRVARKTHWRDVKLSTGETVTAETARSIFEDAAMALKAKSRRRKRAHVAVA